jgi:hypothetical protein
MNKMLKRELVNLNSKEKTYVNFFEDDTIETVRQQSAKSANSHPDRMFILASIKLPQDHYTNNIENWRDLFDRLSYNGEKLEKTLFDEYQRNYRFPNTTVRFEDYDKSQWMDFPESLIHIFAPDGVFSEYRTLGVDSDRSYILELSGEGVFAKRIPSAKLPDPQNSKLINSFYKMDDIDHFGYQTYNAIHENVALYYYPKLTPETPSRMNDETVRLLDKNANLLQNILKLKVPHEKKVTILTAKFYVPWIETRFGASTRTRFEQIFYGITVSDEIPYVGYFTCKDEINRHKFYVEDAKTKTPKLDVQMWKYWWNHTKPSQNKPTLLFYKGKSKDCFDRIAVTEEGMSLRSVRQPNCTDTLDQIKKNFEKWLSTLDALIPFLNPKDIAIERWDIQDAAINVYYSHPIKSLSLLRFKCISPFFGINPKKESVFTFLRNDNENFGLSSIEATIIEMMNEGPVVAEKLAEELSITPRHAAQLIKHITTLLDENPALRNIALRGFPTMEITSDYIYVKGITNIDLVIKYTNFLRYITSNPKSKELDEICPARSERIEAVKTVISKGDDDDFSIFGDFGDLDMTVDDANNKLIDDETPEDTGEREISNQRQTKYGYFKSKLEEFDPAMYKGKTKFAKACEYMLQPIPITPEKEKQLSEFMDGDFKYIDPSKEDEYLETKGPDGKYICPEYWCTLDEIPLRENQLIHEKGNLLCPVCKKGIHDGTNSLKEFPLIERKKAHIYPKLKTQVSSTGKQFPCCYQTPRSKRIIKDDESDSKDKAYVFQSSVNDLKELRLAKLDKTLLESFIVEDYSSLDNQRLSDNKTGFFRVGLGNPIKNLAKFLSLKGTRVPLPHEVPTITLRCSFLRNWSVLTDTHAKKVYDSLTGIKNEKTRERLSKIISGISDAFVEEKLSNLDALEYLTAAYKCGTYLISDSKIVCSFGLSYATKEIVIFKMGETLSILAKVTRHGNKFIFLSNIMSEEFNPKTRKNLKENKDECTREIPSYEDAVNVVSMIFPEESYTLVVDPYERAEAIYIPKKLILPFRPSPIPESSVDKIYGFESVNQLPSFADMSRVLEKAQTVSPGYAFTDSMYDVNGNVTEVLTASGLRILVKPFSDDKPSVPGEVIKTVEDEEELVSADSDPEFKNRYAEVSYISEVHEFLLFQLSKDLETEDYRKLRSEFEESDIKRKSAEKELESWFYKTVSFLEIKESQAFISKIRAPCGQFTKDTCKGNLCGWDGKVCRIQVKNSLDESELFGRLFRTMFSNSKIRSAVLDGRITPFFSTILYIELPHEWIATDKDIF